MAKQRTKNEDSKFDSVVYDSAKGGNVDDLVAALAAHPKLIDTPNPLFLNQTPLYAAAEGGHTKVIEKLIELGSRAIDVPEFSDMTPLIGAAMNGHGEVIETLVRLGSRGLDVPTTFGWTAMHAAAGNGQVSAIETLVRLGSNDIDTPDMHGRTPFYEATRSGQVEAMGALVRFGSKAINVPDSSGWTPLDRAGVQRQFGSVKLLKALDIDATSPIKVQGRVFELAEDEVKAVRFGVYFAESLVHRLLFELDRISNVQTRLLLAQQNADQKRDRQCAVS